MKSIFPLLETYLTVLVHPFRIHQQFRYNVAIPNQGGYLYPPLTLAESLGISWIFSVIRGICKIVIINFFLHSFLTMQSEEFPILQELVQSSSISTYYFLLFSAALDIIFFPVVALIVTEFWAWVIRIFAGWLNPNLDREAIADQITTHALSSNLFSMIPFLGEFLQSILYYFLIYAGLRSNLGASRSLAWVILLAPSVAAMMLLALFSLMLFYLAG